MKRLTSSATNLIAAITAIAWIIAVIIGQSEQAALALGFIPARMSGVAVPWLAVPAVATPLTATLVHSGLIHLAFNLLVFVWCGQAVERVLGKGGLVVLYLIGAYAAALAQWAADPMGAVPMVGASGAISAVMGAFALSFGRAKRISSSPAVNRWVNVLWLLVAWVVLQLMMSWLAGGQGFLLATPAHVGGFAAGLLLQRPLLLWRYRSA
ncbi:MAG TPA: rhomboid family intramembrane serine protease [Sphingomicrobium sp.]|nr:rhomboid family intramembrane serine protease [Sphingomicrobium sp.]